MGVLYDYFHAPGIAEVRRHLDQNEGESPVPDTFEGVFVKQIDPTVLLGQLVGFAGGRTWAPDLVQEKLVWPEDAEDSEGPWVTVLDDNTRDVLAAITAERMPELAGRWAAVEEFGGHLDATLLGETIEELAALAGRARAQGESLYCWICL